VDLDQAIDDQATDDQTTDAPPDLTPDAGPPPVVVCQNPKLTPPAVGTCTVTAGSNGALLVRGRLLLPEQVMTNGHVLVNDDGRIVCVGCDCSGHPDFAGATVLACANGVVSPGLINPHDHITYTMAHPATPATVRYDHRHEWREGLAGKPEIDVPQDKNKHGVKWGELRMILGGATSILGSGGTKGLLRNLDKDNEGLGVPSAIYDTFPLDDSSGLLLGSGCAYPSLPNRNKVLAATAYVPHVAEGVIAAARNEFLCLSGLQAGGVDVTVPKSAFIHSVGLTATDALDMAIGDTTAVWSPRSNISLYGFTADVVMFENLGVRIALGTDWSASGSMNLLRELACAGYLNQTHYGGFFSDKQLFQMVTTNAAAAAGVEDRIGRLEKRQWADLLILGNGDHRQDYDAVVYAGIADVALVLRGGEALYGEDALVTALSPKGCERLSVCGRSMQVCLERETGMKLAELQAEMSSAYPLFFCGTPKDEPTCKPSRPGEFGGVTGGDSDGDGIADAQDLCPTVFDPVRPMDGGKQRDTDGDQLGDACDPCPLEANVTQCQTTPTPGDGDADGVKDASDNCPKVYNKAQKDKDGDGIGDACDPCPRPNPGGGACPYTVKELRDPSLGVRPPDGTLVRIKGVTVLGVRTSKPSWYGVYVREGTGDHEAIFIYTKSTVPAAKGAAPLVVGDVVTVEGTLSTYKQIEELSAPLTFAVTGSATTEPRTVTTAELEPGSQSAEALESQLVRVAGVTVAAKLPGSDAFWVTDSHASCTGTAPACAKVNDFFYDGGATNQKPPSSVGQTFNSIVGVINGYSGDHTLEPRNDTDLQ
jgi:cytosine/adenosine deaminase-related metal-dependent hydrolase